ncbi:hypothetical protein NQ317_011592 [Molorchus minor]|uniref:Methyltransferase-like protein 15 homolog n=1 Tax=Molorchus minor TaxID=1323400 RepID=A0ABQ9IX35_9CUCU|nr:hypothetical protein NQ317_011592 [Molorchus minor]
MAAAAGSYKRFLTLLEKWPIDKNKLGGRDLGEYLRHYINQAYKENKFEKNIKYWDQQYIALQKLVNDDHKNKYKRSLSSSATGLTAQQCNIALSDEFFEEIKKRTNQSSKSYFLCVMIKSKMLLSKKNLVIFRFLRKLCSVSKSFAENNLAHASVMPEETLKYLKPENNQTILDMTFGAGGHSRRILQVSPNIKLLALDRDPRAYGYAQQLQKEYPDKVIPLLGCFSELPSLLKAEGIRPNSVDSILFDFGCSSMQFDEAHRGFSISKKWTIRYEDGWRQTFRQLYAPTAADVLANATEEDLYKIIKYYGEEKQARKITRAIVDARYLLKKLTTTEELADLVDSVVTEDFRLDKLQRRSHVATKTFQALRIFVNNELNEINYGLILAHHYLKIGGRMVTITFHSLEDTIVKRHLSGNLLENAANPLPLKFSSHASVDGDIVKGIMELKWRSLHKHVLVPRYEEIEENPRSRSAKLRAAIKIC